MASQVEQYGQYTDLYTDRNIWHKNTDRFIIKIRRFTAVQFSDTASYENGTIIRKPYYRTVQP